MKVWLGIWLLITTPFLIAFDFSKHSIPLSEIRSGGPPKDGIPALMQPKFVSAKNVRFLRDEDRVLALIHKSEAKAYPINNFRFMTS